MLEDNITKGRIKLPPKLLLWGPPGVGKSTFCAGNDKALFLEAETRISHLDIHRLKLESWDQTLGVLYEVLQGGSPYKCVVIDTVDALEQLLFRHLAKEAGCASHLDIGGGYYQFRAGAKQQWKRMINLLDKLGESGVQCVLLCHAEIKPYNPPEGVPYDRWALNLDQSGARFLIENMDLVGYAKFVDVVKKERGAQKARAVTTGQRKIQFKYHPAFPTKQGIPFPDEIDLSWESFLGAMKESQ